MQTGGHGDDVGLAAVTGAAVGTVRRFTPIEPQRALQAALAPLDDDQYDSKLGPLCVGTLKLSINQPFIVLTETKFSYRYIPVWARYSPHLMTEATMAAVRTF